MASPQEMQISEEKPAVEEAEKPTAPAKNEPPKELEEDATRDSSSKIKEAVTFLTPDTTINVLPSTVGNMLASLQDGGLGSLVACARASVGVKTGRYMFEAKIVETTAVAKNVSLRVGFATEGSLFLGEDSNSICFDNTGNLISNKKKTKCFAGNVAVDTMIAVVLNLDESSPNNNTISLFRNGVRVAQPQPLPDELKDKALFPAISFQHATVHYNFGPAVVPLPFTCRAIGEATAKHASITKYDAPDNGKYTVMFPVSMPDEGSTTGWMLSS
jgi:hypothetical protein